MDTFATLLFLISSILSFLFGKYYRKLLPFLGVSRKNNESIDFKKLSLDCAIMTLEDDMFAHPSQLKFFLELSGIGIWQYRISDGKLQININIARIFGFEVVESLKLDTLLKLILIPEDIQGLIRSFNGVISTKKEFENVFQIISNDGKLKTLRITMGYSQNGSRESAIIGNIQQLDCQLSEILFQEQFKHRVE
jgi:PAS domain-containing protein